MGRNGFRKKNITTIILKTRRFDDVDSAVIIILSVLDRLVFAADDDS